MVNDRIRVRLGELSARLGDADWLDGAFSAADILMVHVLRRLEGSGMLDEYPNLAAYIARAEAGRPQARFRCTIGGVHRQRLRCGLRVGPRKQRHHVHAVARKDREVRMALEQLRGGFMRRRAHDDENGQLINNVRDAIRDVRLVGRAARPCRRWRPDAPRPRLSRRRALPRPSRAVPPRTSHTRPASADSSYC